MTAHNRKLKTLTLDIDGVQYQKQVTNWRMVNGTDEPETVYVFSPGDEFADEADPSWTLELTFLADWTAAGLSTFLTEHNAEEVPFQVDHHPDIPTDHVRWVGVLKLKAPDVGGEVRATETTELTMKVVGEPVFSRP